MTTRAHQWMLKGMPIPEYFDIRKQIAAEWLSNEEYQMINAPEPAVYHWGIVGGYADRTIEIWIPIEKNNSLCRLCYASGIFTKAAGQEAPFRRSNQDLPKT